MRRFILSRSEYLLALGVLYNYFQNRPKLFFLRELSQDRRLFARYLHWASPVRHWADWQLVQLYNLYERRIQSHQLLHLSPTESDLSIQAFLLRYYMYSEHNPAKTDDVLKAHPHWTKSQKKAFYQIEDNGYAPSFSLVFEYFTKKKDSDLLSFSQPLCFSLSAQHPSLIDLKKQLQEQHPLNLTNKKENIVIC